MKRKQTAPGYQLPLPVKKGYERNANKQLSLAPRTYGGVPMRFRDLQENFDTSTSPAVEDSGEAYSLVADIARGTSVNERTGNKISIKRVDISMYLRNTLSTNADPLYAPGNFKFRIMLIQDKQANGALATMDTIYENPFDEAIPRGMQFMNYENRMRFTVLAEWEMTATAPSLSAVDLTRFNYTAPTKSVTYTPKKPIVVYWDEADTTGAQTAMRSNNLILTVACMTACGISGYNHNSGSLATNTRVWFT